LGVLLCQLNTLRYRFLHFLDHLRFFELQLTKLFLLQLYHLLLRHHFLVQILLVAQLAQLCVQELTLLEMVSLLANSFGFLKVPGHL
jgi:hypothetical protein